MPVSNIILLSSTVGQMSITGTAVRGESYSLAQGGIYSAAIHAVNLTGRVIIEGTLATRPKETDWFPIKFEPTNTNYVEFPYSGDSTTVDGRQVVSFQFKGHLMWMRARLDRTYLDLPSDADPDDYGSVYRVNLLVSESAIDPSPPTSGSTISTITTNMLGNGIAIPTTVSGTEHVVLNYRTLRAGLGISLSQSETEVTIQTNSEGYTRFTGLDDTPNTIRSNAVVIGLGETLAFSNAATANSAFTYTNGAFGWKAIGELGTSMPIKKSGNTVVTSNSINFVGNSVTVRNTNGAAEVEIDTQNVEWVYFQYTPGSAGNFNMVDVLLSKTSGVTVQIVDAINCIVAFTFTGRVIPPSSIAVMGQAYSTNEFNFTNVSSAMGTRKIAGGGTSASPTLMAAFTGPVTLQLRMSDTGASAGAGQRAKTAVIFKF